MEFIQGVQKGVHIGIMGAIYRKHEAQMKSSGCYLPRFQVSGAMHVAADRGYCRGAVH